MFDAPSTPTEPTSPPAARAEARMGLLRRMAETGVRMGERLDRQSELAAVYAETCAVPEHLQPPYAKRLDEIARAFAQLCRAVAMAVALEERIDNDLQAGPVAAADRALRRDLTALRLELARRTADAKPASPTAGSPRSRMWDLRPRLDSFDRDALDEIDALLRRPHDEILARIHRDLGLGRDDVSTPSPAEGATRASPRRAVRPFDPEPKRPETLAEGARRSKATVSPSASP